MSHDNRIVSDPVVNPYQFAHHQQSQPRVSSASSASASAPPSSSSSSVVAADPSHNLHLHQHQHQHQHRVPIQRATSSSAVPMAAMPPAATFTMNRQQPLSAASASPASTVPSSSLAQTAMPAPAIMSGTMYHHQQPLAIETKKKRNVKEPSQSDLDLKVLINNVDQFSLKDLASLIRQLEVDGGIIEKKSKLNDKKQSITKVAPIDGSGDSQETKLDTQQFKQILLSLPAAKRQQLFGTAWLRKACKVSNESHVPRNRIFAKYVTICADHGVPSLSPAPFGKLLRMIFPFITIHRYGVRGQSKYHYCGIQLIENESASEVASPLKSVFDGIDSAITSSTQSPLYSATQLSPASTVCSSFTGPSMLQFPPHASASSRSASASASAAALSASLTDYCEDPGMKFTENLLSQLETFGTSVNAEEELHLFLKLPSIEPFLPSSEPSNSDIAATLYSLYKSHCTSVFESLRYMKLKTLQKSLNMFQRSLTNPVFKLYTSEPVMKWVQKSDIIMYQSILKMLGKLTLQEVPVHVLKQLKHISNVYPTLLAESLVNLPKRLCYLKLTSAKKFCNLMAKIVEISQLCAKIGGFIGSSSADANVAKALYHSWTDNVNATDIVLQDFAFHDSNAEILIKVFSHELPNLLLAEPSSNPTEKVSTSDTPSTTTKLEGLIFKWLSYISSLPSRIHNISPKIFALLFNNLLDSALKSIFYIDEQSFVAWWSIKSWLIEWLNWYGELGGFLAMFENEHANEALINSLASAGEELMRSTDTLESLMESTMMKGDVSANTTTQTTNTDLGNFSSVNSRPDLTQNNDSSILSIHHNENDNINVDVNVSTTSNTITNHHQSHSNGKNVNNLDNINHLNNLNNVNNINNHLGNPNGVNNTDEENQTEEIVPRSFNGDATTGPNNNTNDNINVSGDSNTNSNANGDGNANDDGKIPVDLLGGYFGPVDEKELMAFFS